MRRIWWWWKHLGFVHYMQDLGPVYRTDTLPMGGLVKFRHCRECGRSFVEFT